ncbi:MULTISPECIES: ABC transporter permease [Rhodococcus]|uniref:ABC transporter permease n=1 Tax=Rhodococcus parequi TaxID=3137122 RepID=A0ABW9FEU8_9NOCA
MTSTPTATGEGPSAHDPDSEVEVDPARARKERIGRYVAMILLPFLMVGMMITGYLATMHAPTPHDMPVAVAGPAPQAERFADALAAENPSAVDVRVVATDADARQSVLDREVAGAVVLSEQAQGTATVYTATAAGASQVGTVTGLLAPEVLAQGLTLEAEDLAPLPANDSAGLTAMFMTTALMLAGYMPLSVMLSNSPELLRFRRFVPLLAGWSALIAGLVWLVAGPILGALDGNTAAILGVSWLAVFAVGSVQLFLTRILGPMAVLAGMLFLMVLGVPASNMGMSVFTMPSFYATLHTFLPTPATGEALRSVLYFGGNGVGTHLAVLGVGAVLALAATLGVDALKRRRNPDAGTPQVTMPSLTAGPRPTSNKVRYATLAIFPLGMVAMMITFMLGAMYQPAPQDMPVAVVAADTEQAEQAVGGLDRNMPGLFDLRASDSVDAARHQVEDRTVVAAYVLPSADNPSATLITNQAAGVSQHQVVTQVFGQVAAGQQVPLSGETVTSLDTGDTMGTVSLYVAMGWIMAGFMIVVVASNAAPMVMGLRTLLPILAGWAVFMSVVVWLIAGPIVGAVDGHFLPLVGTGIVAIIATALFATVFVRLLGLLAVLPVVAILMFLGVPASGGALSIYMEPALFRFLHDILPMPAAVESVRSILYFAGDTVGSHVVTFVIWGVVSLLCVVIIDRLRPSPRTDAVHEAPRSAADATL